MADKLVGVGLVVLLAWVAWQAVPLVRADFKMLEARSLVLAWGEGQGAYTLRSWLRARDDLNAALKITPGNPAIHDLLATLYLLRARDAGGQRRGAARAVSSRRAPTRKPRSSCAPTTAGPGPPWPKAARPCSPAPSRCGRPGARRSGSRPSSSPSPGHSPAPPWPPGSQAPPDVRSWTKAFRNARPPKQQAVLDQMAEQYKVDLAAGAKTP